MLIPVDFIRSPNFTETGQAGRKVDLIVIHTMEIAEKGDTAEACARFFARSTTKASAHYCIDNNSIVQCVNQEDVAWAAPGANHDGIQLEHAGFARQTSDQWQDDYSQAMLKLSADLAADIAKRHDIPLTYLRSPDVAAQRRGITTHYHVSEAFHLSTHTDPGPRFPVGQYMSLVTKASQPGPERQKIKTPPPTLEEGDRGWRVKQAQKLLVAANQKLQADGVFGKFTTAAVKAFQKRADLHQDGVIGPMTWKALWEYYYLAK